MAARDVIHGITTHSNALVQEQKELCRSLMRVSEAEVHLLSGQHSAITKLPGLGPWHVASELACLHPERAAWFTCGGSAE